MKKSNALMLSYMIFLALAILAEVIFDWKGLGRISIAATVAGCFFAFADLSNWYVSYQSSLLDVLQKDFDVLVEFFNAILKSVRANQKEMKDAVELIAPYKNNVDAISNLFSNSNEFINDSKAQEKELEQLRASCDDLKAMIDKERKKVARIKTAEIVFVTVGFVSFFALIAFDWLLNTLTPYQSIATVVAFVVIMLNYYLRDLLEEKAKSDIEETLAKIQKEKEEVEEILKEAEKTPLLDKTKELVENILRLEKLKKQNEELKAEAEGVEL